MTAFITSCVFVVLAEMGDKTQLLAMAFASRYKASVVMLGVFIATVLNHALAVGVGQLLTSIVPLDIIKFIAALSFIAFGLWTLHADTLDENDQKSCHVNPLICVAVAFFFAEMGDKTQLATVSLAVQFNAPIAVLAGTTAGMLIADAIGIMIGVIMHRHIPQGVIHIASAVIFMLFGLIGTHHFLAARLSPALTWSLLTAVSLGALFASRFILSKEGHGS